VLLRSLEVQHFRILKEVHLKFGRGLNVLFGPNDLGKSSLADALRAAFLLPFGSTESREFVPWGTDLVPRVVVEFEVNGVVRQITKTFGSGARGTALLERVGERGSLLEEARGRAVEGRLRELLEWGIPAPGGKGAPRRFPESYLTIALLGRQDKVGAILEASLEDDGVETGRRFVTDALGVLRQHPMVCRLLQRLESITEEVFTPTGMKKRTGPLADLTVKITELEQQRAKLEEELRKGQAIEAKVQSLTGDRYRESEECSCLQRRHEQLQAVRKAEEELERVRAKERAVEDARRDLAIVEDDVTHKERSANRPYRQFGRPRRNYERSGSGWRRPRARRRRSGRAPSLLTKLAGPSAPPSAISRPARHNLPERSSKPGSKFKFTSWSCPTMRRNTHGRSRLRFMQRTSPSWRGCLPSGGRPTRLLRP
jgi:AAA domain-containing protein